MGGTNERAAQILAGARRQTYHEQDGKIMLNTYQDVEPHLEYAKKLRRADAEDRGKFGKRRDFHRGMSVPFNLIQLVAQKLGIPPAKIFDAECGKRIWKELKTSEYKNFRTSTDKRL